MKHPYECMVSLDITNEFFDVIQNLCLLWLIWADSYDAFLSKVILEEKIKYKISKGNLPIKIPRYHRGEMRHKQETWDVLILDENSG